MSDKIELRTKGGIPVLSSRIIEEGTTHNIFGELAPDESKAYVELEICKSFPMVAGPEMGGRYYGYHPKVLAANCQSLLHQQTNFGHKLQAYGHSSRDYINGCVVQAAFPDFFGGGIPESIEAAPSLKVLAVLFKKAQGVTKFLGEHLSGRTISSVSIEAGFYADESGVWDPGSREIYAQTALPDEVAAQVKVGKDGVTLGRVEAGQLAWAIGGTGEGHCQFHGFGYTPTPAESTAKISKIAASGGGDSYTLIAASDPDWYCGRQVSWTPTSSLCWGRGEIKSVAHEGSFRTGRYTCHASAEDPALEIELPSGTIIWRNANSVKKS